MKEIRYTLLTEVSYAAFREALSKEKISYEKR